MARLTSISRPLGLLNRLFAGTLAASAIVSLSAEIPLLSPRPGEVVRGNTAHLAWSPVAGADGYEVWIDGRLAARASTGRTDHVTFPLAFGAREWSVVAKRDGLELDRSATGRFSLEDSTLRDLPDGAQLLRHGWRMRSAAVAAQSGAELASGEADVSDWWSATLPSTCLTTLVRNGVYPNPYEGLGNMRIPDASDAFNEKHDLLRFSHLPGSNPWAAPYWFRTSFVAAPSLGKAPRVWLNLGEINYRAEVWLNGRLMAEGDELVGMERSFRIDVTDALRRDGTENHLAIAISGLDTPAEPSPPPLDVFQFPGRNMGADGMISHNYTKWDAIGWDWQPAARDRDMGLVEDVFLEPSADVELVNLYVASVFSGDTLDEADVVASLDVVNRSPAKREGELNLALKDPNGKVVARLERPFALAAGSTMSVAWSGSEYRELRLRDPKLWWPHGYGEQPLYELEVALRSRDGQSDVEGTRFGIRRVRTYLSPTSNSRVFEINGEPIYSQGGNWVIDWLLNWTASRYEREIVSAKRANLNTLRIWGPTGVAPQRLYEAADREGVLIWQDFLNDFWGTGKNTPGFVPEESLFREASAAIIRKLRNHPSLIIWCGGNEGPNPREDLLREELARLDPLGGRYYLRASDNDGLKGGGPYHNLPPRDYFGHEKLNHFNSEIGPSGVPEWESLQRFLDFPPTSWAAGRFPLNGEWTYHDATNRGEGDTRKFTHYDDVLRHSYGAVEGPGLSGVHEYALKCQLVNFEAYRAAVEALNKGLGETNTGFSFWKYNSSWPSVLWQLIDWYEQPHAGFYGARKALEILHPQFNYDDGSISVVNRERRPRSATLEAEGFSLSGTPLFSHRESISVPVGSSAMAEWKPPAAGEELRFLRLRLLDAKGKLIATNTYWQQKDDRYEALWQAPAARLRIATRGDIAKGAVKVTLSCPADSGPVVFSRLKLVDAASGVEPLPTWWSDNYISLMPGESRQLEVEVPVERAPARYRIEAVSPFSLTVE